MPSLKDEIKRAKSLLQELKKKTRKGERDKALASDVYRALFQVNHSISLMHEIASGTGAKYEQHPWIVGGKVVINDAVIDRDIKALDVLLNKIK